ncbi:MAG: 30S ribosomal protein S17 [Planctomycetota bacterium]
MSDETGQEQQASRERQYAAGDRGKRAVFEGVVVSTKCDKMAVVSIERMEMHGKYKKYIRQHSKVYAHDEQNTAREGDTVRVVECRPLSKLKRFRLMSVLKRAHAE